MKLKEAFDLAQKEGVSVRTIYKRMQKKNGKQPKETNFNYDDETPKGEWI